MRDVSGVQLIEQIPIGPTVREWQAEVDSGDESGSIHRSIVSRTLAGGVHEEVEHPDSLYAGFNIF
jgi:hypothetical protein